MRRMVDCYSDSFTLSEYLIISEEMMRSLSASDIYLVTKLRFHFHVIYMYEPSNGAEPL